ncbi:MAG: histidine kinase [Cytophagaceae bacterium]|nr:histidine kinase [Gemmatimonadaceae bacterium]
MTTPPHAPDIPRWRLVAILSAIALGASVVRTVTQVQTFASAGVPMGLRVLVPTEVGNWIGWTLWAVILTAAIRRFVQPARSPAAGVGILVLLTLAPILVVPILASPGHWLGFDSAGLAQSARHMTGHNFPTNLLLGVAMVGVAQGYMGLQRARRLELTTARLHAQLADAQLETLRAQLNPHFLFNALNSIAVLARRGQVGPVEQMVTRLAGLLRHSLDSARSQLVPLRVELEALRHYLEIEQVRHGARLDVTWAIADALHDRIVPSFLLQPLVENTIRHGFDDPVRPLHVVVGAATTGAHLVLTVFDDGAGLAAREAPEDGIGLGHTRARLAGLYGGKATLTLAPGEGGRGARVTITIPEGTRPGAQA